MRLRLADSQGATHIPGNIANSGRPRSNDKLGRRLMHCLLQSTGEGKQASGELQSQFSARQSELENLQKSIEDLQTRLSAGAASQPHSAYRCH